MQVNNTTLIIGGGAAGMLAAVFSARSGADTILLEQNEKLGKKLFITGKGRCNLTNACDTEDLFKSVVSNPKFLYSAFYGFSNFDTMAFFEGLGVKIKTERGNRVFPESDKSSDIISALHRELKRLEVKILLKTKVTGILTEDGSLKGVSLANGEEVFGDKLILATGGLSYPSTGSTGDGYHFAEKMGHTIKKLSPSLVPFCIQETYVKELQGLSLKNIEAVIYAGKKEIYREFGEMLFTHFGVSGPVILSGSCFAAPYLGKENITLSIDLKPALTIEQLDGRMIREFEQYKNKQFKNSLEQLLPRKLIPVIISLSGIPEEKKVNLITREERMNLVRTMKNMILTVSGFRDYNEAIITRGGISTKEVNPSTMESKLIKGVYFAGEVLDLDALTGGFNLQVAWSTAYLAGNSQGNGGK